MDPRWAFLLVCLAFGSPAAGGAWLREPGTGFLSLSATQRFYQPGTGTELALYGEYGLTPRLTFGLDLNDQPGQSGHALAFVRLPITPPASRLRAALELAAGAHHQGYDWHPMTKGTVSLGRGFESGLGFGWWSVDAAIEQRFGPGDEIYKLDATAGLSPTTRPRPLLKVETSKVAGKRLFWAITPSLTLKDKRGRVWVAGIERKYAGRNSIGLVARLWLDF
jgi:hypothetical protein